MPQFNTLAEQDAYDVDHLSGLLLCMIICRPGDGRHANYNVDAFKRIFSLDNEASLLEPVASNLKESIIYFCSILFCRFPDFVLDMRVLEQFAYLLHDLILNDVAAAVLLKEKQWKKLRKCLVGRWLCKTLILFPHS